MVNVDFLKKVQNRNSIREVLGSLVIKPSLLIDYKINKNDFVDSLHKIIFVSINNLTNLGVVKINGTVIGEYLKNTYPTEYLLYKKSNGTEFIDKAASYATLENFKANYDEMKKFSLLRDLAVNNFDISDFYDPDEFDSSIISRKRKFFEECDLDDITNYYKKKIFNITQEYTNRSSRDSMKAGTFSSEQKEKWKTTPNYGLSYSSNFFTTVVRGMQKKKFGVLSAGTGVGKTRLSVANICHSFVSKYYDSSLGKFVENPHGNQNRALYIGTEMELLEEIEPILWAYIADVPEEHITQNKYEPGEESRVDEAIRILRDESNIYLEYVPDYNIEALEAIIEKYVSLYKVGHVFFDYIHITTDLISEYQSNAKAKMEVREDQVLSNLSTKLKDLARKYNISLDSWTQVSGDFKNEKNRDQTIVRGAKSIIDKTDWAGIVSRPTKRELKLLEKIIRSNIALGKPDPNVCISIYKNRGGKYNNIKIWLYVDYDTMRVHDLFVTDYDYTLSEIKQSYVCVDENQKITVVDKKQNIYRMKYDKNFSSMDSTEDDNSDEEEIIAEEKLDSSDIDLKDFEDNGVSKEIIMAIDMSEDLNSIFDSNIDLKKEDIKKNKSFLEDEDIPQEINFGANNENGELIF